MSRRLCALFAVASLSGLASSASPPASAPERASPYRAYLVSQSVRLWGANPPVPLFAGQIHQESAWNPNARSAYACGLTQFTPDTAKWIAEAYAVDVGAGHCTDPRWAIRAMVRYNKHLSDAIRLTATTCDNAKFFLSAYNGGLGWVIRDRKKAADAGKDPSRYAEVAPFNAGRGAEFFAENRDYPEKIVRHQRLYSDWGGPITCKEEVNVNSYPGFLHKVRTDDPWRCAGVDRLVCALRNLRPGANAPK